MGSLIMMCSEMGKLLLQSIFVFPRSFFYPVSAPLDSANPYFGVSCPPGDSVQNLDRYLLISQVWLQIYCFYWHVFCLGYLQTPSQLRDMKHWVYV